MTLLCLFSNFFIHLKGILTGECTHGMMTLVFTRLFFLKLVSLLLPLVWVDVVLFGVTLRGSVPLTNPRSYLLAYRLTSYKLWWSSCNSEESMFNCEKCLQTFCLNVAVCAKCTVGFPLEKSSEVQGEYWIRCPLSSHVQSGEHRVTQGAHHLL